MTTSSLSRAETPDVPVKHGSRKWAVSTAAVGGVLLLVLCIGLGVGLSGSTGSSKASNVVVAPNISATDASVAAGEPVVSTLISAGVAVGALEVPILTVGGFRIGDRIVLSPGTPSEEENWVEGFRENGARRRRASGVSIILRYPLQFEHPAGATIEKVVAPGTTIGPAVATTMVYPTTIATLVELQQVAYTFEGVAVTALDRADISQVVDEVVKYTVSHSSLAVDDIQAVDVVAAPESRRRSRRQFVPSSNDRVQVFVTFTDVVDEGLAEVTAANVTASNSGDEPLEFELENTGVLMYVTGDINSGTAEFDGAELIDWTSVTTTTSTTMLKFNAANYPDICFDNTAPFALTEAEQTCLETATQAECDFASLLETLAADIEKFDISPLIDAVASTMRTLGVSAGVEPVMTTMQRSSACSKLPLNSEHIGVYVVVAGDKMVKDTAI